MNLFKHSDTKEKLYNLIASMRGRFPTVQKDRMLKVMSEELAKASLNIISDERAFYNMMKRLAAEVS